MRSGVLLLILVCRTSQRFEARGCSGDAITVAARQRVVWGSQRCGSIMRGVDLGCIKSIHKLRVYCVQNFKLIGYQENKIQTMEQK